METDPRYGGRPLLWRPTPAMEWGWAIPVEARDVNDNTSSSIIKLGYRIVSISKRNENIQKAKILIQTKIKRLEIK